MLYKTFLKTSFCLVFASTYINFGYGADAASSSNSQSTTARLNSLSSDDLEGISRYLQPGDFQKLTELSGDRLLKLKMPSYLESALTEFDLRKPGRVNALIKFLQGTQNPRVRLKLQGVTPHNLNQILPYCQNVVSLDLSWNKVGAVGAKAIAASETLANLTRLTLLWNNIDAEGVKAIAASSTLANLTSLNLYENNISDVGARAIAASQTLVNLTDLDLGQNNIDAEGVKAIAGSQTLANLTHLDLSGNPIGDAGAQAIAVSPTMVNLIHLYLNWNQIGGVGARAIAASQILVNLRGLNLRMNKIGADGDQFIRKKYPFARL